MASRNPGRSQCLCDLESYAGHKEKTQLSMERGGLSRPFIHSGDIYNPSSMASPFLDTGDPK